MVISSRYGLIPNGASGAALLVCCVFVFAGIFFSPNASYAQDVPLWWGSSAWFDWSDYRASGGVRLLLAKLATGNVRVGDREFGLAGGSLGLNTELEAFPEVWGTFYVDRLGIRGHAETHTFTGRSDDPADQRVSRLDADFSRVGIDLDLIRFPFLKFGIDGDYQFNPVIYRDRSDAFALIQNEVPYRSREAWTLGIHGQVIPTRIRDVPVIAHARFRFPMPFMSSNMARITDWEIGAGFRPAIWETSMFAHSTFSFGVETGYRSINLDMRATATEAVFLSNEIEVKARWEGAYFQAQVFF